MNDWLRRLRAHLKVDELIQGTCQAILELSGADRCSIMVLDAVRDELVVRWAQGERVRPYGKIRFRMGEGLCGWVARTQKPLFSLDVTKELRYLPAERKPRGFKPVRSLCCLPLITQGRTVGVVNLSSFRSDPSFCMRVRGRLTQQFLTPLAGVIEQSALLREAEAISQRFRRIVKQTSEAVAQVSHEIRTPLTSIQEGTQQLLDGLKGEVSAPQREILAMVHAQAERMLRLVTELLDLSRIEVGRLSLQRRPTDGGELLKEIQNRYRPLVAPRRFLLRTDSVPPIYADRIRLTQVVENLLTNAIKFTPPEGSITLHLTAHGRSAELSVNDTGVGIPKTEQRHLFERFFQPKLPVPLTPRGTGLGLAIAKEIVQLHGGTIRVASVYGKGTTFTVSLPLYTPAFALTEEFRLLREQAAREGLTLAVLTLKTQPAEVLERAKVIQLLEQNLAREDRVLIHPEGGLVILLVSQPEGAKIVRSRLEGVLLARPELVPVETLRWGWVLVPEEETHLPEALKLAQKRSEEGQVTLLKRPLT